jgi:hypothetical protein
MRPYSNGGVLIVDAMYAPYTAPGFKLSVQGSTADTVCLIVSNDRYDPKTGKADIDDLAQVYLDAESGYALLDHLKAILPIRTPA